MIFGLMGATLGGACQTFALVEKNLPNALGRYTVKRGRCDIHDVSVMFLSDTT